MVFLFKLASVVTVPIFIADIADHITGKASLTLTVTIAKNTGGFGARHSATPIVEVGGVGNGSGHYIVALDATDTNTLGTLIIHYDGDAGSDPADEYIQIVAFNPNDATALGLSQLDLAVQLLQNKLVINETTSKLELYDDTGVTVILSWDLTDKDGSPIVLQGTGPANRGVPS